MPNPTTPPPQTAPFTSRTIQIKLHTEHPKVQPHYSFQLLGDGYQKWTDCGPTGQIIRDRLAGGDYTLLAKDTANQLESRVQFSIKRTVFEHWWVWLIGLFYVFGVAGIVLYLFLLYRFRQKIRILQTRDRIARDLHDDMGSYLSSISILSRSAALNTTRDPDRAQQSIERIGQTARQVMGAMSDIVWSINPDHDSMEKVVTRMRDVANELFADTGTTISLEADPAVLTLSLPLEKRHDFFLIFKEALTNTARYAEATQVRVRLQREGTGLCLTILDNGRGFDVAQPQARSGGGNGLKNMHKRADNIGGTLHIDSTSGQGTTVRLVVKE